MRYVLLIGLVICFAGACKVQKNTKAVPNSNVGSVILSVHLYPMRSLRQYRLTQNRVEIRNVDASTGLDSLLGSFDCKRAPSSEFSALFSAFDKDAYINPCMEDGQLMTMSLELNDSTVGEVQFSNFPHENLEKIIIYINENVDKKFAIYYSREQLIRDLKGCI